MSNPNLPSGGMPDFTMPAMHNLRRIQTEQERLQAEVLKTVNEANEKKADRQKRTDDRMQQMVALSEATAQATAELAQIAGSQAQESKRLGLLTWILSVAVIFDIIQGSFDDHSVITALVSAALSVVVVAAARTIGGFVMMRKKK